MGRQDAGQFSSFTVISNAGKTTRISFLSWLRLLHTVAMVIDRVGPGEAVPACKIMRNV